MTRPDPRVFQFLIVLSPLLGQHFPMLAKVCSAAVSGIEACSVEVEVNAGYGDAILVIVSRILPMDLG